MTGARWIDRSPTAYAHRALHALPEPVRWGLAWFALIGALLVTWWLVYFVLMAMMTAT